MVRGLNDWDSYLIQMQQINFKLKVANVNCQIRSTEGEVFSNFYLELNIFWEINHDFSLQNFKNHLEKVNERNFIVSFMSRSFRLQNLLRCIKWVLFLN